MKSPKKNPPAEDPPPWQRDQQRLFEYWRSLGLEREKNLWSALCNVGREYFVPEGLRARAYRDHPLSIGQGQTISQPTTVAVMLRRLFVQPGQRVLEIGGGSGYQAALLGWLTGGTGIVISLEYHPELAKIANANISRWLEEAPLPKNSDAREVRQRLRRNPPVVLAGDGGEGCPDHPLFSGKPPRFERVIAACACPQIPPAWQEQLVNGGRIVAPVGGRGGQKMLGAEKTSDPDTGKTLWKQTQVGDFIFVPLLGKAGY